MPYRYMNVIAGCAFVMFLLGALSCSENCTKPCPEESPPEEILPPGKLPWPHQPPDISQADFYCLVKRLWVVNNFGQYQGGDTRESLYFHDGLDIVLANGTKIYAVQNGTVRAIGGGDEYYHTVIIEDRDQPGSGWGYTHVYNFQVQVGDTVSQGTYIADVNFMGLPHVHFGRVHLFPGGTWDNAYDLEATMPDSFFVFEDTVPPVIETPFYFFRNESDWQFPRISQPVLSGDVDIVAGIRDPGEYAHSKESLFGDRLTVARIEYVIACPDDHLIHMESFDFSKIVLNRRENAKAEDPTKVEAVYKFRYVIQPEGPPSWDKVFSFYVITNTDGRYPVGEVEPSRSAYGWDTAATDGNGDPLYPNGEYTITVTAWDSSGNSARASQVVQIAN